MMRSFDSRSEPSQASSTLLLRIPHCSISSKKNVHSLSIFRSDHLSLLKELTSSSINMWIVIWPHGAMDYLVIFSVIIMDAKLGQGFIMNLVVFDL